MYNKMNLFIFYAEVQPVFVFATNISTFVLTAKINMTFFLDKNIFLEILFL